MTSFSNAAREYIERGYDEAFNQKFGDANRAAPFYLEDRQWFISMLESAAESAATFQPLEDRGHKDRQRAMDKLQTAAGKLVEAFEGLDLDALAYLYRCVAAVAAGEGEADKHSPISYFIEACAERGQVVGALGKVHAAAILASKTLPKLDKVNAQASVACSVGNTFHMRGLDFPVSDTGFAADCLAAVFDLTGWEKGSLRYWIQRGREHPWSSWNFSHTSIYATPKK
ncbi:hypothetical protein ACO2Q2_09040 [Dyella sp. KRB-257]|uniref:hypothetical protein n=1 Tax=Dyella sp. KRB-257 TaxID=3400915 RepID=UPI003C0B4022